MLRPGGLLGVASTDWGGALLLPERPELQRAIDVHLAARRAAGGDPAGRPAPAGRAGRGRFELVDVGARYECEAPPWRFSAYLADRRPEHRPAIEAWPREPGALYAMAWIHAVGRR